MMKFRSLIFNYLKTLHPRVYFQVAPKDAQFPYIVFDIVNIFNDSESQVIASVDIDGWDDDVDTTALETLMASVNGDSENFSSSGLDKKVLSNNEITSICYLDNIIPLRDDDPRIKRRKYSYKCKIYSIGGQL